MYVCKYALQIPKLPGLIHVTMSPCAVSSWNSSDHHGKAFSVVSFLSSCLLVLSVSFQLLHVSHPSIFSLVVLFFSFPLHIIPFSNLFDCITCPKNPSFLLI